ncbi:MAG: hypothetical protein LC799_11020 [Actinobacteria bacterium]|nr:hypothetical protein [Actinomycetota bacterium]
MKSQKSRQPRAELRVQSVEGDGWTWCYVEPEDGVELYSNETFSTADEAKDWARRAYPDLPFAEADEEDAAEGQDEKEEEKDEG